MTADPTDNIVQFPRPESPEQDVDPHREVIATLTHIIRQMSGLVNAINDGPTNAADKAKYATWLCSASALCLRAQLEYFDQYIGGIERFSCDPSLRPPLPPVPPT